MAVLSVAVLAIIFIHINKKIEFTINYGDVFAYNGYNDTWTDEEPRCKAAGFLCLGVNTVVNVVNYGDILQLRFLVVCMV